MQRCFKYPKHEVSDFTNNYITPLLDKLSNENKDIRIMGVFNIKLINYNDYKNTGNFLDTIFSQSFLPYITTPTRITRNTKTLIDNIYYNKPLNNIISGNLSSIISDHLIQFLIEPLDFSEKCKDAIKILTNSILRLTLLKLIGMIFALLLMQVMHLPIFSKSQTSF